MGLKEQILDDFKTAMKAREKEKISTLKMLKAAILNKEIDKGEDLKEDEIKVLLAKEAKQRKDSIEQFEAGGRDEMAAKESRELELINSYLPEKMDSTELEALVEEVQKNKLNCLCQTNIHKLYTYSFYPKLPYLVYLYQYIF
jgi:hypothetical protein